MATTAYKPDQGYWTRICSAIGWGLVVAWAAGFAYSQTRVIELPIDDATGQPVVQPDLVAGIAAGVVLLIGLFVVTWFVYRKKETSEFLIATDGEMKKVNWSTRREIIGSTWVVIGVAVTIALFLFAVDLMFRFIFGEIGLLKA